VNFVQRQAGRAGDVDQDALRALDGIVFEQGAGDGAIGGIHARLAPVPTAVP